jgi:hypothetical protein
MTTSYVGEFTIGGAVPGALAGVSAGIGGVNAALPDLQARLAALLAFQPAPISFAAQLSLAQATLSGIQLAIASGITPPDISAQLAAIAALVADLAAAVAGIDVQLTILSNLQTLLAAAGLHVYAFAGATNAAGGELTTALSGGVPGGAPTTAANALVLVTTVSATWAAMQGVFEVSP